MSLSLEIGLDALNSYRRLAYSPWHAIAEFVDNATQSYFDNREALDGAFESASQKGEESALFVSIVYDTDNDGSFLRISDNAMGMSYGELERALQIGRPPPNPTGRSKYGMGLKTAASWIGDLWTVRTKRLGDTVEHEVTIDIKNVIAAQKGTLPYRSEDNRDATDHYTIVEIRRLNREFRGRTIRKIRDYLRSMYREDFRKRDLILNWRGETLAWQEWDMLADRENNPYRKDFHFKVDGKPVHGWVGILARGTRGNAGFSILHSGRVVRGWPDAWRPASLYGQIQGSNDLVNQRLTGEIHLDFFDVSHTKDDILWLGDQEEDIESQLEQTCRDYKDIALHFRKRQDDERGPSDSEVDVAVDEFRKELLSPEMVDRIEFHDLPPPDLVRETLQTLTSTANSRGQETLNATIGSLRARIYLASDMSVNDPYVAADSARRDEVIVMVNTVHPHWIQIKGSDGVLNYLRHCTYDAIAEWQARQQRSQLDTDTIKLLKDRLLRVSFDIERHGGGKPDHD